MVLVRFQRALQSGELALHYLGRIALFNSVHARVCKVFGSGGCGDGPAPLEARIGRLTLLESRFGILLNDLSVVLRL